MELSPCTSRGTSSSPHKAFIIPSTNQWGVIFPIRQAMSVWEEVRNLDTPDNQPKVRWLVKIVRDGAKIHGHLSLLESHVLPFHFTYIPTILQASQWSRASLKCSWTQRRQWGRTLGRTRKASQRKWYKNETEEEYQDGERLKRNIPDWIYSLFIKAQRPQKVWHAHEQESWVWARVVGRVRR